LAASYAPLCCASILGKTPGSLAPMSPKAQYTFYSCNFIGKSFNFGSSFHTCSIKSNDTTL